MRLLRKAHPYARELHSGPIHVYIVQLGEALLEVLRRRQPEHLGLHPHIPDETHGEAHGGQGHTAGLVPAHPILENGQQQQVLHEHPALILLRALKVELQTAHIQKPERSAADKFKIESQNNLRFHFEHIVLSVAATRYRHELGDVRWVDLLVFAGDEQRRHPQQLETALRDRLLLEVPVDQVRAHEQRLVF